MVVEMTSLQGFMGRYYALHSGEPPAVAQAIYEHYLPRFAGDAAPQAAPRAGRGPGRPAGYAGRTVRRRAGSHRQQGPLRPAPGRPGAGAEP